MSTTVEVCLWCHRHDDYRDHSLYAPSQWEMTLHCNVISHWLGAYMKWSLWLWRYHFMGGVLVKSDLALSQLHLAWMEGPISHKIYEILLKFCKNVCCCFMKIDDEIQSSGMEIAILGWEIIQIRQLFYYPTSDICRKRQTCLTFWHPFAKTGDQVTILLSCCDMCKFVYQ